MLKWLLMAYWLVWVLFAVFSYSLTDPNLVLSSWQPYWSFQQWIWQTVFSSAQLLTTLYLSLVVVLFVTYAAIINTLRRSSLIYQRSALQLVGIWLVVVSPLLLSYNALSHDVFNYIFNAKMVVEYQTNPHTHTALEFGSDDWTRFMHNTHTSAPYGYGWTAVSLLPYLAGFGKFALTWLSFRIWAVASVVGLFYALRHAGKSFLGRQLRTEELAVVFFNPLLLIEVISSMHNDLWMVVPAVLALSLVWRLKENWRKKGAVLLAGVAALLAFSVSIKFATLVLLPVIALMLWEKMILDWVVKQVVTRFPMVKPVVHRATEWLESYIVQFVPLLASVALFLPLLTSRSQYFHPWYLLWSFVWWPLLNSKLWKAVLVLFSLTSLLRYAPWLWAGGFASDTLFWQQVFTWTVPVLVLILWFAVYPPLHTNVRRIVTRLGE